MKIRVLLAIITFALIICVTQAYCQNITGEGTIESPYLIYSAEDLKRIGNDEEWTLDKHYKMMNDIVLGKPNETESNWTPIGTFDDPFTGTFDGNNKKVIGMVITRTKENHISSYVGFFGVTSGEGAKIQRLGLEDVNISLDLDASVIAFTGALAGVNIGGTIRECYSEGNITGGKLFTGGLIGLCQGGSVELCYSKTNVKDDGKENRDVFFYNSVGGLIGLISNSTTTITRCYTTGDIYSSGIAGGLIGLEYSITIIENCYATGNITGQISLGGLVGSGSDSDNIKNCYFSGNLIGERNITYIRVFDSPTCGSPGGICGVTSNDIIENCVVLSEKIESKGPFVGDPKMGLGYLFPAELFPQRYKAKNNYILDDIEIIPLNDYKNEYLKSYTSEKNKLKSKEELTTQATYEELGWDFTGPDAVWEFSGDYKLPKLLGVGGQDELITPEHLL